jgi:hypothetical protein
MNTAKHIRNLFALSIAAIAFTACGKEERIAPAAAPLQEHYSGDTKPYHSPPAAQGDLDRRMRFEKQHIGREVRPERPISAGTSMHITQQELRPVAAGTAAIQQQFPVGEVMGATYAFSDEDAPGARIEWPHLVHGSAPYEGQDSD